MVRRAFKILQQMMLNLIIILESARFFKVCDDFVELGIKVSSLYNACKHT